MITRKITYLLISCLTFILIVGCGNNINYNQNYKVVYHLNGGIYQNSNLDVTYYYGFNDNGEHLIYSPYDLTKKEVTKAGYRLVGWFKDPELLNEFDFENDTISKEGIELYASWKKLLNHQFIVCYVDDNEEIVELGSYSVDEGSSFSDYSKYSNKRLGYTFLGYYLSSDFSEENKLDINTFKHPGGNSDQAIYIYCKYIQGYYALVSNVKELRKAINNNIYLLNDLDLNGEDFSFNDYQYHLMGNGYKISNFHLQYDPTREGLKQDREDENNKSLYISLMGNGNGTIIEDVSFENITVEVKTILTMTYKIYVSTLFIDALNVTLNNVQYQSHLTIKQLPNGFDEENLIIINTEPALAGLEAISSNNVTISQIRGE